MPISRRNFLQTGAVVALTAGTPLTLSALTSRSKVGQSNGVASRASGMCKAAFAAHLNTTFALRRGDGDELTVKLVEIQDRVPKSRQRVAILRGKECFALAFSDASSLPSGQSTYRFRHDEMGEFDLFVGTVESRRHGQILEAIVNHLDA